MGLSDEFLDFFKFEDTDVTRFLETMPYKTLALFFGNQAGKTASVAYHYVQRVFGTHKIWEKNLLAKKIRCMSSSLPESSSPEEQDNTQYLELKRLIPPMFIEKDVNSRNHNLVVRRPPGLNSRNTVFEFRSSKQEMQDLGKIQLSSVWHDEETPRGHRGECLPRLLKESGDEIFSLTPTNALTYTFDEIWQRAEYIYRTDTIVDKFGLPQHEYPNKNTGIACMQAATDDNPTLEKGTIERLFENETDPILYNIRRYGIFAAISGKIHKAYDPTYCYLPMEKTFPNGIPHEWVHARGIDYHESRIPWSIGWLSCSPTDEWFLWREMHPAIDGPKAYNTYEIAQAIARQSEDYDFSVNLIDPLANKKQPNTLFSATDDLNRHFEQIREDYGIGRPTWWQGWDTKGTTGRDTIGMRFKNAVRCARPFNNTIREHGRTRHLPTLWIMDTAPNFHKSITNWRYNEYVLAATKAVNDLNSKPQQKHSHDNMVLECLAKNNILQNASYLHKHPPKQNRRKNISVSGR